METMWSEDIIHEKQKLRAKQDMSDYNGYTCTFS